MRDPVDVEIGTKMRSLRSMRRLSLEQVGEQLGLSYQQVRKYELGDNRISASTLSRVATVLGVNVSYFFAERIGSNASSSAIANEPVRDVLDSIEDVRVRAILHDLLAALIDQRNVMK